MIRYILSIGLSLKTSKLVQNSIILLSFITNILKNITNSLVESYILFNFAAKIKEI